MELQDYLQKAGVIVVGPAGRLKQALSKAEEEDLDAALLDVDLNGERCWPVADALARRNIPFALTTGFATAIVTPERFRTRPVLSKPYREKSILAVLAAILAEPVARPRNG
jgi:DNA-binding response OmpR family regulator